MDTRFLALSFSLEMFISMHLLVPCHVTDINRAIEVFMFCLCFKARKNSLFYLFVNGWEIKSQ